jgi:putative restriction endonuclease
MKTKLTNWEEALLTSLIEIHIEGNSTALNLSGDILPKRNLIIKRAGSKTKEKNKRYAIQACLQKLRDKNFLEFDSNEQGIYHLNFDNEYVRFLITENTGFNKTKIISEDDELSFPEGKTIYRIHRTRERNQKVVKLAKEKFIGEHGYLYCEACGFSFKEKYGDIGKGFIEAHHVLPLSQIQNEVNTKIKDIVLLCSNCHRIIHRKRPWLNKNELKSLIKHK